MASVKIVSTEVYHPAYKISNEELALQAELQRTSLSAFGSSLAVRIVITRRTMKRAHFIWLLKHPKSY